MEKNLLEIYKFNEEFDKEDDVRLYSRGWITPDGDIIKTNNAPHYTHTHKTEDQDDDIRYNFGYERYIGLPEVRPTYKQLEALKSLLYYYFIDASSVGIRDTDIEINYDMNDKGDFKYFSISPKDYTPEEVIKIIQRLYNRRLGEELLSEYLETKEFKPYTAGYVKEDGSLIILDEYHGEDESLRDFNYPEFSNTHPEEDTCIRLYKEPNQNQYKILEYIIDYYLDKESYCKIEIWNIKTKNPDFYKIYSLFEGACKDYQWNENIGNWTGYKLIQIIKNQFKNKDLNEYLTKSVNNKNIFDTTTLGGFSYYTQCIPGDSENEYMKNKKNRVGEIVQMSPDEYFSLCAKMFDTTIEDLKEQKLLDEGEEYINKLKDVILKEKKQFPMTFICLPDKQQEGLHRMYVAGELFGWDEKFPVLVINKYNKLKEQLLLELNRNQLINKSKKSDNYKDQSKGRNRWERRNRSRIATRVDQYNKIDMNDFFKKDELKVGINVHGETDDYVVLIRYNGALREIAEQIKRNNNKLEFKCILIALQRVFNSGNVFVSCTCLHPDTKIKLLDGTTRTIEQMKLDFDSGEKLWVYSVDENGNFKPGEVENIWVSGEATEFIKIILDNDKEILTTPEHLYMLRDGTYIQAQELKENDSLMPLYFNEKNGYETVKSNTTYRYKSVYKEVAKALKFDEIEETKKRVKPEDNMSYDVVIHHKDFNKKNNNPDNLQVMTAREHWTYHANLCGSNRPVTEKMRKASRQNAYKRNANPTPVMIESRKKFQEKGRLRNYDEDRKQQQSEIMHKTMTNYYTNISEDKLAEIKTKRLVGYKKAVENGCLKTEKFKTAALNRGKDMHTPEREALSKAGVIMYYSDPKNREDHKRKLLETKILNVLKYLIDNHLELTDDNYELVRRNNKKGYPRITKRFSNINEAVSYFELNHKVKKVERIVLPNTPVYDISIKNYANFLVEAGVILHNCKDWKYRQSYNASKGGYNSGPIEVRASDITNPGDTKGAGCKHVNLVLGNIDWIMKVASVINNYIHFIETRMERKYADIIFPKLFGISYDKAVQLNLFDTDDNLDDSEEEIKLSNRYGRIRTRFISDQQINNMRNFNKKEKSIDNPNEPKLDLNMARKENEIKQDIKNGTN